MKKGEVVLLEEPNPQSVTSYHLTDETHPVVSHCSYAANPDVVVARWWERTRRKNIAAPADPLCHREAESRGGWMKSRAAQVGSISQYDRCCGNPVDWTRETQR